MQLVVAALVMANLRSSAAEQVKVARLAAPNARGTPESFCAFTGRRDRRVVSGQFLDYGTQASLNEVADQVMQEYDR